MNRESRSQPSSPQKVNLSYISTLILFKCFINHYSAPILVTPPSNPNPSRVHARAKTCACAIWGLFTSEIKAKDELLSLSFIQRKPINADVLYVDSSLEMMVFYETNQ